MVSPAWSRRVANGDVHVIVSTRADGDFHAVDVPAVQLEQRRRRLVDLPWTMLDEVHGIAVVDVAEPGANDGMRGDVAVTTAPEAVLGVWVGDCAPLVLTADGGALATVHAGWRGVAAGIVAVAVDRVRTQADGPVRAYLGPCIRGCCDEFGADELAVVARGVGVAEPTITAITSWGSRSLDLPAAVAAALALAGVTDVTDSGACTRCEPRWFSHRRGERQRHVVAAWIAAAAAEPAR